MNDRKQLRKVRQVEKLEQNYIDTATRALLQSPDGRRFLWWLLSITHYGETPYTSNALATAFACGEHNIGQQLLAQLTSVDPEGFLNLLKERNDDRRNDEYGDDGRDEAGDGTDDD